MGLLEIFNSVFFVPNFQLPNALVTAAARLGCVSEVKRGTSLWIPDTEFPMLNITLRFNQEWEMGFKKKVRERICDVNYQHASGAFGRDVFALGGERFSSILLGWRKLLRLHVWCQGWRTVGLVSEESAAAGGSESGFFRTACQSQAPGTRSFLQEEAGVRRGKDWDGGRRRELWVCLRVSVAAAKVTLDHCNWRPLIDLSQQMMCRFKYILGFISFILDTGPTHPLNSTWSHLFLVLLCTINQCKSFKKNLIH